MRKIYTTLFLFLFTIINVSAATKIYNVLYNDNAAALVSVITSNLSNYKDYEFVFDSQTTYTNIYQIAIPATVTSVKFKSNSSNGSMPTVYFYGLTFNDALCANVTFDGLRLLSTAATKYVVAIETASKYPTNVTIQNCDIGSAANTSVTPNLSPYSAVVRFRNANTYAFGNVTISNTIFRNMGTAAVSNESTTTGTIEGVSISNCTFVDCNQGLSYQPNLLNAFGNPTTINVSNCTYYNSTNPANFNRLPSTLTNITFDKLLFSYGGSVPVTLKVFYGASAISLASSYITKTADVTLTNPGSPAVTNYNGLATALMSASASGTYTITDASFAGKSSVGDQRWFYPVSVTKGSSSLSGFTYNSGAGPSASQNFTLSAVALRAAITVTAPTNYEVSTDNTTFANSVSVGTAGSDLSSTNIYVRLKAGLSIATYNSEQISISTSGITSQTVTCSGSVVSGIYQLSTPGNISTTGRTTDGFTVNWADVSNESSYTVKVYQSDGVTEIVEKTQTGIAANSTSASFSGLSAGTTYKYSIIAVGDGVNYDNSAASAMTTVTTVSTAKAITVFSITGQNSSTINGLNISVSMPFGTNVASLTPAITHTGESVSPSGAQDFTNPVQYTVTAEDNSTQVYTVTVTLGSGATDYYRTKNTGNWNDAATWESSPDNSNWYNATAYPDASANTVTLLHNVSYAGTPTTVGNVTVNSGVTLTNTTTAIAVASGKTLTISSGGYFDNQINGVTITAGSGAIQVNGTYKITNTTGLSAVLVFTNFTFSTSSTLYIGGTGGPRIPSSVAGNVEWASTGGGSFLNSGSNTISGNLTVSNGTGINNGSGGAPRSLTISGNLIISGGQYNPLGKPGIGTNAMSATINGNVYLSGNGKLYGAQPGSSAGLGTLNIKGNIYIQNPSTAVVLSGGATSKGSLILNGTSQQSFNIEPSVMISQYSIDSLTISNSNNVILNSNLTLNNLTLTSGNIIPGSYTLTVKGATSGTGKIQNTASSVLEYSGTSAQTISNLNSTDVSGLVISNTAGVTLADNLNATTVTLNPDAKFTVATGKTLTTNGITLNSNASGTATLVVDGDFVNTGSATANQYLATTRNWYISSPVSNAKAPAGYTYYQRDEAGSSWTSRPFVADSTFVRGRGYIALPGSEAAVITFSTETGGSLNTGDIPVYLTFAGASSKGYNLIGNPYPSHLTWTKTFVDNNASLIEPSIYYRTTTGTANNQTGWSFKTINASTGEVSPLGTSNTIPPMQAFWIRAKATGTLTLNSDLTKSHQASNPLKAPATKNADRQRLRLQVDNGTATDEAVIYFDAAASDAYDRYDSPKFNEANTVTQIYTTAGSEKLVINGMHSLPLNHEIGLGFVPGSATAFSLRATELTNIPSDVRVILKDNVSKAETDLTDGVSVYEFAPATTTDNRFSVIFRTAGVTTGFEKSIEPKAYVYVNANNQITINASEKSNYSIYNAVGQLMENGILNSQFIIHNSKLATGVYVVKVDNQSIRVVIK